MRYLGNRAAKRFRRQTALMAAGALLVVGPLTTASAQEAVRASMASAQAAEQRRRAATVLGHPSLSVGPTVWKFGTGLGLEYNDNVDYAESHQKSDFIFRPQVNTRMLWPVSDRNSIDLSLGAGYLAYLQHSEFSRYFITPGSELSFDLYAGDFWINLHDRISVRENAYQDPSAAGTGDYSQLENTAGVTALWDLNKAVLRWGYDHQNYSVLSGEQGRPDGQSEVFFTSAGYAPKPEVVYGVELGGSLIRYDSANTSYSDATTWNAGGFYEAPVTEYIHVSGHAGYTVYTPDSSGTAGAEDDFSGMYAQLALRHRVNRHVNYSLSGSRSIQTTFQGGSVEMYSLSWQANWQIIRKTSLSTSFIYHRGSDLRSGGETFDQYGPQVRLGWRLSDKVSTSLGYQVYWRASDESGREYSVNIVSLSLSYAF